MSCQSLSKLFDYEQGFAILCAPAGILSAKKSPRPPLSHSVPHPLFPTPPLPIRICPHPKISTLLDDFTAALRNAPWGLGFGQQRERLIFIPQVSEILKLSASPFRWEIDITRALRAWADDMSVRALLHVVYEFPIGLSEYQNDMKGGLVEVTGEMRLQYLRECDKTDELSSNHASSSSSSPTKSPNISQRMRNLLSRSDTKCLMPPSRVYALDVVICAKNLKSAFFLTKVPHPCILKFATTPNILASLSDAVFFSGDCKEATSTPLYFPGIRGFRPFRYWLPSEGSLPFPVMELDAYYRGGSVTLAGLRRYLVQQALAERCTLLRAIAPLRPLSQTLGTEPHPYYKLIIDINFMCGSLCEFCREFCWLVTFCPHCLRVCG